MACCKVCCGCKDCAEGDQGKCCCGDTCCQEGENCCNGECQEEPCDGCDPPCSSGDCCVDGECVAQSFRPGWQGGCYDSVEDCMASIDPACAGVPVPPDAGDPCFIRWLVCEEPVFGCPPDCPP